MAKKSKISIRPLDDRIVVQRIETEEKTAGGIVLPDSAREKSQEAKVMAVGAGKVLDSGERVKPEIEVEDIILIGKYSGTEIKIGGEEYVIIRESEVLAKIQ